jgi:hypothetical protein
MKTILHTQTLLYYDGPQVFEACDSIGGHYVAVMVDHEDRYLVCGVKPESLREFRSGMLDLRSLLLEQGEGEWYLGYVQQDVEGFVLGLELQNLNLLQSDLLPESGFVLHETEASELALMEARQRNNFVLEVSVEPPEAAMEHRIHVPTFVGLLSHLQTLVKNAYAFARRELSQSTKKALDSNDAHLLDVVIPAAAGSFRVFFEASKRPDMLGESELKRAMDLVDKIFAAGETGSALEVAKKYKGHLAGSYLKLLRFLVQHKTGLKYSWAQPNSIKVNNYSVSQANASFILDALSEVYNLSEEEVILNGTLEKADIVNGTWRLKTSDGSSSGETPAGGPSLDGLKIGSRYRFLCTETVQESDATGTEKRSLFLMKHELE